MSQWFAAKYQFGVAGNSTWAILGCCWKHCWKDVKATGMGSGRLCGKAEAGEGEVERRFLGFMSAFPTLTVHLHGGTETPLSLIPHCLPPRFIPFCGFLVKSAAALDAL